MLLLLLEFYFVFIIMKYNILSSFQIVLVKSLIFFLNKGVHNTFMDNK